MSTVVTNQSLLSQEMLYAQVNKHYGHGTVTNFGLLDPGLAAKQINAAVGSKVFHKNGPLDKGIGDPGWSPATLGADRGI
jgi:hypothetical protein